MPNPIKYNLSVQSKALKRGNFFIGTGDDSKGNTSISEYWNGITPPSGGYTIYLNKASQGPSIYVAANDSELISLTNRIASTSYTTVVECLSWFLTQTDKMILNKDYESIVTNGLVMNLDAGFVSSYPKSGKTLYDLSNSGNNSTLINGPTYNSGSGGSIVLDGVNDYIDCGNGSSLQITSSITVETWVYLTSLNNSTDMNLLGKYSNAGGSSYQGWLLFKSTANYVSYGPGGSGPNTNEFAWLATSNGSFSGALIGTGVQVSANTWYQVVGVFNSSNDSMQIYTNGILRRSSVRTGQTPGVLLNASRNVCVGATPDDSNRFIQGNIPLSRVYNRVLTSTEVLQNFNAQKGRFGL